MNDDADFEELPEQEPSWLRLQRATACRKQLLAAGYKPLPVNGKEPPIKGWQDIVASATIIDSWETKYAEAVSTGILTETVPAIDIDILHPDAAAAVEALARAAQKQLLAIAAGHLDDAERCRSAIARTRATNAARRLLKYIPRKPPPASITARELLDRL